MKRFNLNNEIGIKEFNLLVQKLKDKKAIVELSEVSKVRSLAQNRSLHLMFTILSNELNNLGITFTYFGISGKEFELPHTPELVKNFIWKPIQISMYGIESTTKINTEQINAIVDVIADFFAKKGIEINFPSYEQIMNIYER